MNFSVVKVRYDGDAWQHVLANRDGMRKVLETELVCDLRVCFVLFCICVLHVDEQAVEIREQGEARGNSGGGP